MYWKRYQQHIITKLCPVANVVTNIKSWYTLKNTWQQIITKLNTLVNFVSYLKKQKMHWKLDGWHMTCDTWWGVNILSKFQLSSSNGLKVMLFWIYSTNHHLVNYLTKVFVEQPQLHRVCETHDNSLLHNSVHLWTSWYRLEHLKPLEHTQNINSLSNSIIDLDNIKNCNALHNTWQ